MSTLFALILNLFTVCFNKSINYFNLKKDFIFLNTLTEIAAAYNTIKNIKIAPIKINAIISSTPNVKTDNIFSP